jgi:hypothetical protein
MLKNGKKKRCKGCTKKHCTCDITKERLKKNIVSAKKQGLELQKSWNKF